jgi:hypothetical protein
MATAKKAAVAPLHGNSVEIPIAGVPRRMVFTNGCIRAIEAATGTTLYGLVQEPQRLSGAMLTAVVQAGINAAARQGLDPDFGRGNNAYDRGNGDPLHQPNPTLGALERGPFYAIRMTPGDIGTFIGLATDAAGRVLDAQGRPVPGLWAAGNAATPITGGSYPAAGLTIGSAMIFGYLAACDATAAARRQSAAE